MVAFLPVNLEALNNLKLAWHAGTWRHSNYRKISGFGFGLLTVEKIAWLLKKTGANGDGSEVGITLLEIQKFAKE